MQGPLYRVVDLRRSPNDHVLVFAIHHAIADGWSLGVFVEELFAAYIQGLMGSYEAFAAGAANLRGVGRGRARFLAAGGCWSNASSFGKRSSPVRSRTVERADHAGRAAALGFRIPAGAGERDARNWRAAPA